MRWIPLVIVGYLALVVQTSLVGLIALRTRLGVVGPDVPAICAVFLALRAPRAAAAMLAGWVLGLGMDLTTGAGPGGVTVAGPLAISYALAAGLVFGVREGLFADRALSRVLLTAAFVAVAHGLWVTLQALRAGVWTDTGRMLAQAGAVAIYSAALAPLVCAGLDRLQRWLVVVPSRRAR